MEQSFVNARIHIVTLVLDGLPFITCHLPVFNKLPFDWTWSIVEGVAKPIGCTGWCKAIPPRLSTDGTHEYLESIRSHKRVKLYQKPSWEGKLEMINAPCENIKKGDIVLQVDGDEIWTARQIEALVRMLKTDETNNAAMFKMRYFVGHDIAITSDNTYGNHGEYEWRRAWVAQTDEFRFTKHEAPEVNQPALYISREATASLGIVPCHYAYATRKQVEFKRDYYGYANAVKGWERLQANKRFPCRLADYFDWVKDNATVDKLP